MANRRQPIVAALLTKCPGRTTSATSSDVDPHPRLPGHTLRITKIIGTSRPTPLRHCELSSRPPTSIFESSCVAGSIPVRDTRQRAQTRADPQGTTNRRIIQPVIYLEFRPILCSDRGDDREPSPGPLQAKTRKELRTGQVPRTDMPRRDREPVRSAHRDLPEPTRCRACARQTAMHGGCRERQRTHLGVQRS